MQNDTRTIPQVELKEFKVISRFYDVNEADYTTSIEIFLPTPESLGKLCNSQIVKEFVNFNLAKYKSFFIYKNAQYTAEEKIILNLDKIHSIQNKEILPFLIVFLGGINSINSLYDIFGDIGTDNQAREDIYIDSSENYLQYIYSFIDFVKGKEKLNIPFTQMESLLMSLDEVGINIPRKDKNVLYRSVKDSFFMMQKNKILVILAPSNNFWIKSEKTTINDINYDIKLNNYSNIFYNKNFIQKFMTKIARHPRCSFGLLSSMAFRNLKNCWDALERQFSKLCPRKVLFFEQKDHDQIMLDQNKKKMTFFRNMEKIIDHLKREKQKELREKSRQRFIKEENEKNENVEYFNKNNIIILESDEDKMSETTKPNSFIMNVFNEKYLEYNEQNKIAIDLEADKAINYIVNLLENCTDDVRDYLSHNKINNQYSKV
jgi:hypothetical protein